MTLRPQNSVYIPSCTHHSEPHHVLSQTAHIIQPSYAETRLYKHTPGVITACYTSVFSVVPHQTGLLTAFERTITIH
jgi:hypothetical protein